LNKGIKQIGGTLFDVSKRKWELIYEVPFKKTTCRIKILIGKKIKAVIVKRPHTPISHWEIESMKKSVISSTFFKRKVDEIKRWEKTKKQEIKVSDVKYFGTLFENLPCHLIGYRLKSPLTNKDYVLEEKETHDFYDTSEDAYFVIAVEKKEGVLLCMEPSNICETKAPKNEKVKIDKGKVWFSLGFYNQFTHSTFTEDLVEKLVEEPAMKVRKMFLE
jgi:hypothetical protein